MNNDSTIQDLAIIRKMMVHQAVLDVESISVAQTSCLVDEACQTLKGKVGMTVFHVRRILSNHQHNFAWQYIAGLKVQHESLSSYFVLIAPLVEVV